MTKTVRILNAERNEHTRKWKLGDNTCHLVLERCLQVTDADLADDKKSEIYKKLQRFKDKNTVSEESITKATSQQSKTKVQTSTRLRTEGAEEEQGVTHSMWAATFIVSPRGCGPESKMADKTTQFVLMRFEEGRVTGFRCGGYGIGREEEMHKETEVNLDMNLLEKLHFSLVDEDEGKVCFERILIELCLTEVLVIL